MTKIFGRIFVIWLMVSLSGTISVEKYEAKGPNLCSRIDRYEKDVVVPKSKLVKVSHTRLCAAIPPICTYYTWKTIYLNETVKLNHTRNVFDCCKGYKNLQGSCVPICDPGCGHGECIEPNVCLCDEGWKEPSCINECEENTYGRGCTDNCSCMHGATCDKKDGYCHCASGFFGNFCEYTCPYNMYGMNCSQACKCENNAFCDIADGSCECEIGYTGEYCEHKCAEGSHGANCEECVCLPESSDSCDPVTGECICKPGYTGIYCESQCDSFKYGKHCSNKCGCVVQHSEFCDPSDGSCVCKPGWEGDYCSEKCPVGKFGEFCSYNCTPCPSSSATCNHETGFCDCPPGTFGDMCNENCPHGTWSVNCTEKCNCLGKGICDAITGNCICAEGETEPNCSEVTTKTLHENTDIDCDHRHYGPSCTHTCNCFEGELCHRDTGLCSRVKGFPVNDIARKNKVTIGLLTSIVFIAVLAGVFCVLEKTGITSFTRFFLRRNAGSTSGSVSTDRIIGDGLNNPMYDGCRDDLERPAAVSLEGPTYVRYSNFPAEQICHPKAENSRKSDAETGDKRSLILSNIRSMWSEKSPKAGTEDIKKESSDTASVKFEEDFIAVALNDLCPTKESKYENGLLIKENGGPPTQASI